MLNQVFTTENYLKVIRYLNRKGANFERTYFKDIYNEFMHDYKEIKKQIIEIKKRKPIDENKYQKLQERKQGVREKKDALIQEQLINIKLDLIKISKQNVGSKPLYLLDKTNIDYTQELQQELNLRLLYKNLSQVFNIKQANRDIIIHQIKSLLKNNLTDLYLYRFDIKSFYENIDHNKLLAKLTNKTRLLYDNIKLIKDILKQYAEKNNNNTKGIPRGISISALLGEIYLQEFDHVIKDLFSTVYYVRYVDDIFIITKDSNLEAEVKKRLLSLLLETHTTSKKYQHINLDINKNFKINYLGYKFYKKNNKFHVTLSDDRFSKYQDKINKCFDIYDSHNKNNISQERQNQIKGMLKKRLQYLFQNNKIVGYAKVVFTGAYYSNQHITIIDELTKLDKYIKKKLDARNIVFKNFDKKFVYYYQNKNNLQILNLTKSKAQKKHEKICCIWK